MTRHPDLPEGFGGGIRRILPSQDGIIRTANGLPDVRYHLQACSDDLPTRRQAEEAVLGGCRFVVLALDVIRRRRDLSRLEGLATQECLERLAAMAELCVDNPNTTLGLMAASRIYAPVSPRLVNGMVLTSTKVDMAIHVCTGALERWVSLVFTRVHSKWICTLADIG